MLVTIRPAVPAEAEAVRNFYYDLIEAMKAWKYHPKWKKGVYPQEEELRRAIAQGEMRLAADEDNRIVGAMVLNHRESEGYDRAAWKTQAGPHEVMVIHLLCVAPQLGGQGIGKTLVRGAIREARRTGQKAIRLDVLVDNLPAQRLYRSMGFTFVERLKLFYEDTGWCDFDLYEYPIDAEKTE